MSESLKIVGGLLSPDLLGRAFAGDTGVPGTSPESYGLERGESVRRQASKLWPYLLERWQAGAQDERARSGWTRILLRELDFGREIPAHVAYRSVGWDVDLDHRTPGREARAPHSVLQEQLNTDDARLWGILTNGTSLRLLRDSASFVSAQYLEFDLRSIFDGELFADFVQFYLVSHATRFDVRDSGTAGDAAGPETCWLEKWRTESASVGERALAQLRKGVEQAISLLGTGFIAHPANPQLRHRLAAGELRLDDLNRALLRVVYRMLFWFVAEDRDALLLPIPAGSDAENVSAETSGAIASGVSAETPASLREARQRYAGYFSAARLRQLARRQRGTRHGDLFDAVTLVFDALGTEGGMPELALPGIGGIFEAGALDEPLAGARLTNEALLSAIRALALVRSRDGGALRRVDFGNLGAEELGSVYESLLELIPHYDPDKRSYTLTVLPGNERKESGSYYTPTSLVECLLDSALDPLLDEATARGTAAEKVAQLLDMTVCDPACGSGHFLVAAARRIAKRIAVEETGEPEPPEPTIRRALRRVVGRCIYGVDINPMAAELAKVSLWLEALEPGKPLSYLDQSIRVGNSLLGVTPALLAEGLPDVAFTAIEGDDKKVATALRKQNAAERQGQHDLFSQAGIPVTNSVLAKRAGSIAHALPDNLEDLHIHQQRQAEALAASEELRVQKLLADAWCAAFVQPKTEATRSTAITHQVIENFAADDGSLALAAAEQLVADLSRQYRFFHWHVEFPHIINTYAVFAETARAIIGPLGRVGIIVPTGIATDSTTAPFFRDLIKQRRLDSVLDFVTNPEFWQEIGHGRMRFSLLTITGSRVTVAEPEFATLVRHPRYLPSRGKRIRVPASDLLLVNPNSGTCPMFETQRDADITIRIYRNVPPLWREAPEQNLWNLSFLRMFDMTNDATLFQASNEGDSLPLYEAKLIHHFDHRLASYDKRAEGSQDSELPRLDLDEKNDPWRSPSPRYWVAKKEVDDRLTKRAWDKAWLFGWRDITNATNERTMVAAAIPRVGVGNTFFLMLSTEPRIGCLYANLASFALDYVVRQKIAGVHLTYGYVTQLPILPPPSYDDSPLRDFIESRVLELTYTAWDMESFARDLGDDGPPFRWDEERRFLMRAELDALYFHLYGILRDDVDYIMETFPIVKRKDIAAHGTYRTKDTILTIYDQMAKAKSSGTEYQTPLSPPPGQGPRHPARRIAEHRTMSALETPGESIRLRLADAAPRVPRRPSLPRPRQAEPVHPAQPPHAGIA